VQNGRISVYCGPAIVVVIPLIFVLVDLESNSSFLKLREMGWIRKVLLFPAICIAISGWISMVYPAEPQPLSIFFKKGVSLLTENFSDHIKSEQAKIPPKRINLSTEVRRFKLSSFTLPMHVYVSLTDIKSGQVFSRIYVAKYCNAASSLKKGDEYNLLVTRYYLSNDPSEIKYDFIQIESAFCKQ